VATDLLLLPGLLAYAVIARAVLALAPPWKERLFAALNLIAVAILFYAKVRPYTWMLGVYAGVVAVHWGLVRTLARREGRLPWLAFAFPLVLLVLVRFVPTAVYTPLFEGFEVPPPMRTPALFFVGISYAAFRLSWLVLEVRNRIVEPPGLAHYLGFAFFPPIVAVGPITRFSTWDASFKSPSEEVTPFGRSVVRIAVGIAKYAFLANLVNQIAYQALVLDGRPHAKVDWLIAPLAYYVFLYCNFSGFCDIAIGIGGVLRIKIEENFDNPFAARNVQVLWTRWHMTLGAYMRDVLFTPLSKWLIGRLGVRRRDHAVAIAIFAVFFLIGIWHGPTANFVVFGVMNGVAVVATHYYGIALKRRLSKESLRRYQASAVVRTVATAGTILYFTAALGVFANTRSFARNLEFFLHRL
jgi:D-alanyl-lipoteichoic acid acyltransferase DltB (MBOAT superfamily)